jgi:RNA polymerase sigma factor (sigma-70 family)
MRASPNPQGRGPSGCRRRARVRPSDRLVNSDELFLASQGLIDQIVRFTCRRHRLQPPECDDLLSIVRIKLIENDYDILRKFEQRSSLRTFLTVVIQRAYLDYRNTTWGKWRPSAEARRLDPLAVRLEQLIVRDGLSFDEAAEVLVRHDPEGPSRDQLWALAERLPHRVRRHVVPIEAAGEIEASAPDPEAHVARREQARRRDRLQDMLQRAVAQLQDEDRLFMNLLYVDGRKVAEAAAILQADQKALYRRRDRLLVELRHHLEREGIARNEVAEVLRDLEGTGV